MHHDETDVRDQAPENWDEVIKGGEHTIGHDLNFQKERYESKHTVARRSSMV